MPRDGTKNKKIGMRNIINMTPRKGHEKKKKKKKKPIAPPGPYPGLRKFA